MLHLPIRLMSLGFLLLSISGLTESAKAQVSKEIPKSLQSWVDWATWNEIPQEVPAPFDQPSEKLKAWPRLLEMQSSDSGASFTFHIEVFHPTWVTLPGSEEVWPLQVRANQQAIAVMAKKNLPCVFLGKGKWQVSGSFRWPSLPQYFRIPPQTGILQLTQNGIAKPLTTWDQQGVLWLQQAISAQEDKNFLDTKVYRLIRDGSPMWLDTEIELTVSGKNREEILGVILPEGWNVAQLQSSIPCKIDDAGLMKAQVRSGKWKIQVSAFRTEPAQEIRFKEGAKPAVKEELVALQNQLGFREIELSDLPMLDVTQTDFPEAWRGFPLYQWDTQQGIRISEKMRGMGEKKAPGMSIKRQLWLDEDGKHFTFQDQLQGVSQQIWRLDAALGQALGAVKMEGKSQLITENPMTGAQGIEVRKRDLHLEAVGRMEQTKKISATGWQTDAEALDVQLHLAPGWRLFAIFGADWSSGDWLTSWNLLDIFLVLIISFGSIRLWGWKMGFLAFGAFVLSHHELGAPRYTWIVFFAFLAGQHIAPKGLLKNGFTCLSLAALLALLLVLVPFLSKQIQQSIYPQLERPVGLISHTDRRELEDPFAPAESSSSLSSLGDAQRSKSESYSMGKRLRREQDPTHLAYDHQAKIQTGPAVPEWTWKEASFGWSGPVSQEQSVSLWLIPVWAQRLLTLTRVVLILTLLLLFLKRMNFFIYREKSEKPRFTSPPLSASLLILCLAFYGLAAAPLAQAQIPSPEILEELRSRLSEVPNDLDQRAKISQVHLKLRDHALLMTLEVHTSYQAAVPMPGALPHWSPVKVRVSGKEGAPLLRKDGYLWVVLAPGVHEVEIEGMIPQGEWTWGFFLKPQYITIDAPEWEIRGLNPSGTPDTQMVFKEKSPNETEESSYERKDYSPILQIHRTIELGLTWRVTTHVQRLSSSGSAVSFSVPLLAGERVITENFHEKNGRMEILLGSNEDSVSWESEVLPAAQLSLLAEKNDLWVEKWQLLTSPVWNLHFKGLPASFEIDQKQLVPIWQPWPGESVELSISRPHSIPGETMTIHRVKHEMSLGGRQRASQLQLEVQTSLGSEFRIELDPSAELSSLVLNQQEIPVRREGGQLLIPLKPGLQKIDLSWKAPTPLSWKADGDSVKLPTDAANTKTTMRISPDERWILWVNGPQRGPALRFWGVLICAILLGIILGKAPLSPLRAYEWILLLIGLTQAPLWAGFFIVSWFFLLALRGRFGKFLAPLSFNFSQTFLVLALLPVLLIILYILRQGLLGEPNMWILGEGSSANHLQWYEARSTDSNLPIPSVISVSIWFYRFFMLAWAIWLAFAILRWTPWAWLQFAEAGFWKRKQKVSS